MKVYQLVPTLSYGDAVGNDTLALKDALIELGYKTEIYAEGIDARLPKGTAKYFNTMPKLDKDDVVIYHLAIGTDLNRKFAELGCRKIVIYHNVTPPHFFEPYSRNSAKLCEEGLKGARELAGHVDYCLADSAFNKSDLINMGYKCPIDVLPILIPFDDYKKEPDQEVIKKYKDGYTNILFTGRVAPNKKLEDVAKAFHFYKKYYNPKSRLIFVGSFDENDRYYQKLMSFIKSLGTEDIIFPGHIKFNAILAYYSVADVFLCQSEHEGFCVPLVEAMCFDVPIIAYDKAAIKWTLGGSGILLEKKDFVETAGVIDRLVRDEDLRKKVLETQHERLADFDHGVIKNQFAKYLKDFIDGKTK